jgi:hypothetical protein
MSGQIPPYGKHFRLKSEPWTPDLANRVYVLKTDPDWFIRSDKTSKIWRVYQWHLDHSRELATPIGTPLPTFGMAMNRLLEGIDRGFYQAADIETGNEPVEAEQDRMDRALGPDDQDDVADAATLARIESSACDH